MSNAKTTPTPNPQWFIMSPMAPFVRGPKPFKRAPEKHDPSTKTIPDDSFTIEELFNRVRKGAPLPNGIERPIAFGDSPNHNDLDMGRISSLDLSEVKDLLQRVKTTSAYLGERKQALELAEKQAQAPQNNQFPGSPTP